MKKSYLVSTLALGAALLCAAPASTRAFAKSAPQGKTVQNVTVTIDGSGYHPSAVNVKAGAPVRLTFVSKGESCGNGVVIPALKTTFHLKVGQKKTVVFTPKKGQIIAFACSMNMFKGKVVAK